MDIGEKYCIVLVGPKYPVNVGLVARTMMNFSFRRLVLVSPAKEVLESSRLYAAHGAAIIEKQLVYEDLSQALRELKPSVSIGTSGRKASKSVLRQYVSPREMVELCRPLEGRVFLVFGREDIGLKNEELSQLDYVVHIPASSKYSVMNLAVSASILMYEVYMGSAANVKPLRRPASREIVDRIYVETQNIFSTLNLPEVKKNVVLRSLKNVIGRSAPSAKEAGSILWLLRKIRLGIEALKKNQV
ncbi:MAG: TrmJ/YjtD family RNA methyltransferase [Candidatus Brockarchaeota archaeon]|nr:TrmJ/YjtD family RNA methyltransferase [Candidatus Brockarchaeota archaeon]